MNVDKLDCTWVLQRAPEYVQFINSTRKHERNKVTISVMYINDRVKYQQKFFAERRPIFRKNQKIDRNVIDYLNCNSAIINRNLVY